MTGSRLRETKGDISRVVILFLISLGALVYLRFFADSPFELLLVLVISIALFTLVGIWSNFSKKERAKDPNNWIEK